MIGNYALNNLVWLVKIIANARGLVPATKMERSWLLIINLSIAHFNTFFPGILFLIIEDFFGNNFTL